MQGKIPLPHAIRQDELPVGKKKGTNTYLSGTQESRKHEQARRKNGANGMSDMEGEVTRVGTSKAGGKRASIKKF